LTVEYLIAAGACRLGRLAVRVRRPVRREPRHRSALLETGTMLRVRGAASASLCSRRVDDARASCSARAREARRPRLGERRCSTSSAACNGWGGRSKRSSHTL